MSNTDISFPLACSNLMFPLQSCLCSLSLVLWDMSGYSVVHRAARELGEYDTLFKMQYHQRFRSGVRHAMVP